MILRKPYLLETMKKTNPDVIVFRFKAQDGTPVDFTSGMFAMLFYRNSATGEEIGRAFSISNAPPSNYFEFMIAMIHGQMTSKLEAARPGDMYWVSAPYGQFKFDLETGERFLFIAGGTGIAPFFSMMRYAKSVKKRIDASMIYSIKRPFDVIEKDELDAFVKDGLKLTTTVTRPQPEDNWPGPTGHIDPDMIRKYVPDFAGRDCYICGPPNFVNAMKQAVVALGIDEKKVKAEMWGE